VRPLPGAGAKGIGATQKEAHAISQAGPENKNLESLEMSADVASS